MAKYCVKLSDGERTELEGMLSKKKGAGRVLIPVLISLKADCGPDGLNWGDSTKIHRQDRPRTGCPFDRAGL
jgi:hypothetical protein